MSNSVFQSVIQQLKEIPGRVFGVVDSEGCVVSCTDISLLGQRWPEAMPLLSGNEQTVAFEQKTFRAITNSADALEYAAFCSGDDEQAKVLCNMAYIALNDARAYYEEKHDRGTLSRILLWIISCPAISTSGLRNCILLPTHPERYFWCAR